MGFEAGLKAVKHVEKALSSDGHRHRTEWRSRGKSRIRMAQSGTILIREWQGTAHRVTILDDGVSFNGKRFRSLSEVAREITGSRWSGPRFLGLRSHVTENNHGAT